MTTEIRDHDVALGAGELEHRQRCGCVIASASHNVPEIVVFIYCPTHRAAPDLLVAAKVFVTDLDEYTPYLGGGGNERLDALRAAVKQAEGGAA